MINVVNVVFRIKFASQVGEHLRNIQPTPTQFYIVKIKRIATAKSIRYLCLF